MSDKHALANPKLAAYALEALDPAEVSGLEAHLRTCKICQADLAAYRRVSSGLLTAVPAHAPRPAVKLLLQKRLTHQTKPTRSGLHWSPWQLAFAGALALIMGLGIVSVLQLRSLVQDQAELNSRSDSQQLAIAMLAYPSTQTIGFSENGISGSLLVDKQRGLISVFAWHLPVPPAGKTYQMWLIDPQGHRSSGGFLVAESGYPFVIAVITSPSPLSNLKGLGVTVEPVGGSPAPTGPRIFGVDF